MKKGLLGIVFLMGCSTVAFAQHDTINKQRIVLHIAAAFPLGAFYESDFEADFPTFTKQGVRFGASYIRKIYPGVSVGGTVGWRRNPYDLDAFVFPNDPLVTEKKATDWQSLYSLADVYLHKDLTEASFFVKGSIGVARNSSSVLQIRTTYGDIIFPEARNIAFAYAGALGMQVGLSSFGVRLEIGYLATNPTFRSYDAQGSAIDYKQIMHTLDLTVGLTYSF